MFQYISDHRKRVILIFLFKNDNDLLRETGFSEGDIHRLKLEFEKIILEQIDEYYSYVKNEEESIIEKLLIK